MARLEDIFKILKIIKRSKLVFFIYNTTLVKGGVVTLINVTYDPTLAFRYLKEGHYISVCLREKP